MKFERNPKYTTIAIYALIVLIIAMICQQAIKEIGVVFGFFQAVAGFVVPIIYGVVFAFLLNPLLRTYDDKLLPYLFKNKLRPVTRRVIAMVLTYLTAMICMAAFIAIVLPQVLSSLVSILDYVPYSIKTLTFLYNDVTDWIADFMAANMVRDSFGVMDEISVKVLSSISGLLDYLYKLLENAIGTLYTLTASFANGVLNLVLGIIVSIYILMDREKLFAQLKKIGCAVCSKNMYELLYDIAKDINRIFSGFVIGKVVDSLIIGILCMIGMSILQLPYAALISVIVGVTNVIPYFGPFIGAIPGFIIILIADPVKSLWFLLFIFLLQQLDGNVIGPKILGDSIGLSPLWIITSIMLFSGLMGIKGMFVGVPLFAIIYSLVKRFVSFLLRRKGQSTNTRDYATDSNPLIK